MIVVCYGIHKSASTFTYQIVKEILLANFDSVECPDGVFPAKENSLAQFKDIILSDNKVLVIKTHGASTPYVDELKSQTRVLSTANYRDPREIALSMIDHGNRSREQGQENVMAGIETIDDAISLLKVEIKRFETWTAHDFNMPVFYEDICFDSIPNVKKLFTHLTGKPSTDEDAQAILDKFSERKNIMFNKGKKKRYEEDMTQENSQKIVDAFPEFYSKYINN